MNKVYADALSTTSVSTNDVSGVEQNHAKGEFCEPIEQNRKICFVSGPIVGRESDMMPNRGGGYGFRTYFETHVTRIIILGTAAGYYTDAKHNTDEGIISIKQYITEGKGPEILAIVKDVYEKGRAAKQDPTFFVLALLCRSDDLELRKAAWNVVIDLRTFSHLCSFLNFYGKAATSKGWGRLPKTSLQKWILRQEPRDLAYQVFKYLSREGWTFRDMLRCIHIDPSQLAPGMQLVLKLMSKYGSKNMTTQESFDVAFEFAQELSKITLNAIVVNLLSNTEQTEPCSILSLESDVNYLRGIMYMKTVSENNVNYTEMTKQIQEHKFTREFLPTWALNNIDIWVALLLDTANNCIKMPLTGLIRNLGSMTSRGVFTRYPNLSLMVSEYLTNEQVIRKSRVHPATVVVAWKQYASGHGEKGSSSWTPDSVIVSALEKNVNISFGNVKPTGRNVLHCFDGSRSMMSPMEVVKCMTSAEAVGLLGLVCSKTEKPETQRYCIFSSGGSNVSYNYVNTGLKEINMTPDMSLAAATKITQLTNWGSTNISLPIDQKIKEFRNALSKLSVQKQSAFNKALPEKDQEVLKMIRYETNLFLPDAFVVYTDNDVNSGRYPSVALQEYRNVTGINARLAVVATQSSHVSVADPTDAGQMNFVGFDSQLPQLLHDFIAGDL